MDKVALVLVDGNLTEGDACEVCFTAEAYDLPVLLKSIETEDAVFSGGGAIQQLPSGRKRLKWFA